MSFFLAIEPSEEARAEAGRLVEELREAHPAKWQRAEKLHVTLAFLGQPTEEALAALRPRVEAAALRHAPFRLHLVGAGRFVTARAPSVLWLGVDGAMESLRALQADVALAAGAPNERPWVPHLTLARATVAHAFDGLEERLRDLRTPAFEVARVTLFESTHHQYLPRWHVALAGG